LSGEDLVTTGIRRNNQNERGGLIYPSIKQGGRLIQERSVSLEERKKEGRDRAIDLSIKRGGRLNKERSVSFKQGTKEGRDGANELQRSRRARRITTTTKGSMDRSKCAVMFCDGWLFVGCVCCFLAIGWSVAEKGVGKEQIWVMSSSLVKAKDKNSNVPKNVERGGGVKQMPNLAQR
jgi:hypothetical protein